MNQHEGRFNYPCRLCSRGFHTPNALRGHMVTAHGQEDLKVSCQICGKNYSQMDPLKVHLQTVHGIKDLKDWND